MGQNIQLHLSEHSDIEKELKPFHKFEFIFHLQQKIEVILLITPATNTLQVLHLTTYSRWNPTSNIKTVQSEAIMVRANNGNDFLGFFLRKN